MADAIHIHRDQVPAALRAGYEGRKFKAIATESVHIPADAGLWEGGSRTVYTCIELATGESVAHPMTDSAPWHPGRNNVRIALAPGFAIVAHSLFCGKDCGLTYYVHPANMTALIPDQTGAALTQAESVVLACCKSYISKFRREYAARAGVDALAYADAVVTLTAKGMLTRGGALTVTGRNAVTPQV